jgi:hypothetical protein
MKPITTKIIYHYKLAGALTKILKDKAMGKTYRLVFERGLRILWRD